MRLLVLLGLLSLAAFAVDFYVYRNARRFARGRLRRTLPAHRVGLWVLPLVPLVYAATSSWWAVEPKLVRHLVVGLWLLWYVPKLPLAAALALKDAARLASWLFRWFQRRLAPDAAKAVPPPAARDEAAPAEAPLDLTDMKRISRGEFLRRMGWTAASLPFVVVGYGVFCGLYDFDVVRLHVPVPGLPRALDGLRIAQLSDLHAGSLFSERPIEDAVDLVLAERPDLVALTGDYVNHDAAEAHLLLPALDRLRAPLGVYGSLGNHDHYAHVGAVARLVDATAVDLLVNDGRTLAVDGARLHVAGTDNTGFGQRYGDLGRALARTEPNGDDATILLAHDPTFWDAVRADERGRHVDLTLSGHTHGGQIGFELGPARWSLARLMYPRWAGLYREPRGGASGEDGQQFLYVNRGLSTVGPPVRLGIRPEITILTLRRA